MPDAEAVEQVLLGQAIPEQTVLRLEHVLLEMAEQDQVGQSIATHIPAVVAEEIFMHLEPLVLEVLAEAATEN